MEVKVLDYRRQFTRRQVTERLIHEIESEVCAFLKEHGIDVHEFNQGRKGTAALTRELLSDDVYLQLSDETIYRVAKTVTGFVILKDGSLICETGRFTLDGRQTRGPQKKGLSETCRFGEPDKKAFQRGVREEWGLKVRLKQISLLFDPARSKEETAADVLFLTQVCDIQPEELRWQSNIHPSSAYHRLMTHNIISVVVLHLDEWPFANDPHKVTDNETVIYVTQLRPQESIPSEWETLLTRAHSLE